MNLWRAEGEGASAVHHRNPVHAETSLSPASGWLPVSLQGMAQHAIRPTKGAVHTKLRLCLIIPDETSSKLQPLFTRVQHLMSYIF